MKAIIAKNNKGFIGLNGGLPWKSKEDLQHFKKLTLNSTLLVGYRTAQTLPLLKNRIIIIDEKLIYPTDLNLITWCIGGKATYEKYCPIFTELHVSHINDNTEGDTIWPDFTDLNKDCKIFEYFFETS